MNIEELRSYCLSKKEVTESFPFDNDTLVFKVAGKMFAAISLSQPDRCNLKCDPAYALELRNRFSAVQPGYHMNKMHWNTVHFNEDVSDTLMYSLIDHSYEMVAGKLPAKIRKTLGY